MRKNEEPHKKYVVTGASGFIGSALTRFLTSRQHSVIQLVRKHQQEGPNRIFWQPQSNIPNTTALEGADVIVHLAGENILGLWTPAKKKRILQSRVAGTQTLATALTHLKKPPKLFISASATGFYGHRPHETLTEKSPPGQGFLAQVCQKWEAATQPAQKAGIPTLLLRLGAVLHPTGGMLQTMLPLFRLGLGGRLGSGKHYIPWIALEDLTHLIAAAPHLNLQGPLNAVTPHPTTNTELTQTLAHALHRPAICTVPAFAIRLCAGSLGKEVLLASQRIRPEKLQTTPFEFEMPTIQKALQNQLTQP